MQFLKSALNSDITHHLLRNEINKTRENKEVTESRKETNAVK